MHILSEASLGAVHHISVVFKSKAEKKRKGSYVNRNQVYEGSYFMQHRIADSICANIILGFLCNFIFMRFLFCPKVNSFMRFSALSPKSGKHISTHDLFCLMQTKRRYHNFKNSLYIHKKVTEIMHT